MIQTQYWHRNTRKLIMMAQGRATVQLTMYDEPMGLYDVTAEIYALWVNEELRGQGYATTLLDKAEDIARKNGHKSVYLYWSPFEARPWVLDWYYRRGYEKLYLAQHKIGLIKKLI